MNVDGKPGLQPSSSPPSKFRPKQRQVQDLLNPDVLDDETRRLIMQDTMRHRAPLIPSVTSPTEQQTAPAGKHTPSYCIGDAPLYPTQLRSKVKGNSDDLVTVLTSRLNNLEKKHRIYQLELHEMHQKNQNLQDQLEKCLREKQEIECTVITLYDEKKELEQELGEIKRFLGDYGLTWRGGPDGGSKSPHPTSEAQVSASGIPSQTQSSETPKFDLYEGNFPDGARPTTSGSVLNTENHSGANSSPLRGTSSGAVDVALLIKNARILSDYIGYKTVTTDGHKGTIWERDVVRVTIYANGICVNGGVFRPFGWALCEAFTKDLAEGYYPCEFKEKYPDGFPIEIIDCSLEMFSTQAKAVDHEAPPPPGRRLGGRTDETVRTVDQLRNCSYEALSKDQFLQKLPSQMITASGRIVNVRDDIASLIGSTQPQAMATLRPVTSAESASLSQVSAGNGPPPELGKVKGTRTSGTSQMCLEDLIVILVRLPNGQKVILRMAPNTTVGELRAELLKATPSLDKGFQLCQAFPAKTFTEWSRTLKELEFPKSLTLMIKLPRTAA